MASATSDSGATSSNILRRSAQPYSGIPGLDIDVLEVICGSINGIHDLLSVSLTCSLMWGISTRELLRTHTIHLRSRKAIRSFHTFILNHNTTHAHLVRSLVVPETVWHRGATMLYNDAGHLMDILDRAVKLDNLCLCFADEFHAEPARISSAFVGLSALTSLSLIDPGQRWARLALSALQAPLQTLCVRPADKSNVLPSPSPERYLRMFLRFSSSATLTSLRLAQVPMYDNSFSNLPQFPSVRSLGITSPLERGPRLNALLHLFPSLDGTLYFFQDSEQSVHHSMDPTTLTEIQEENRHAQDVSRWAGLDKLECSSATASMLALRCPVRHLTIDSFCHETVISVRPKHLVVAPLRLPFYLSPWRHLETHTYAACPYTTHVVVISSYVSKDYLHGKTLFAQASDFCWDTAFVSHPCIPLHTPDCPCWGEFKFAG